ncbi:MAG: hypothetical protein JWP48_3733 [Actinoallomurus sp.]|jgi:hypothetical protein|nr:hypothetical protein [Actinoallomurus sp.]
MLYDERGWETASAAVVRTGRTGAAVTRTLLCYREPGTPGTPVATERLGGGGRPVQCRRWVMDPRQTCATLSP